MTADHDPFAGYDPMREIHQRINAVHRENQMTGRSNQPLVVDWSDIDAMAEQISRTDFVRLSDLDRNPVAQKLAAEMMELHVAKWKKLGHTLIDTRLCPDYDESDPATMNRPYALTYGNYALIPLSKIDDWKLVGQQILGDRNGCNAHVTVFCDGRNTTEVFAVKRGELICVFKSCKACLEHLNNSQALEYNYTGPTEHWYAEAAQVNPQRDEDEDPWSG